MMDTPDYDVIKDIPGYKVILKAVLKRQIQQLVEQLACHTEEESIILTASVADGTLSHLGSDSGKSFLEDHEDMKSQFLGFCLKAHHRKIQQEKQEQEKLEPMLPMPTTPARYVVPRNLYSPRSPKYISHKFHGPNSVALTRASSMGQLHTSRVRHEPYPTPRAINRATMASFDEESRTDSVKNKVDEHIIKIEPDEENQSESNVNSVITEHCSQSSSPSPTQASFSQVKNESSDKDDDVQSESSTSAILNETLPERLGLDSGFSNLISGIRTSASASQTPVDRYTNANVKLEAVSESEMDLEITGVEPGKLIESPNNWSPAVNMGMNFDPSFPEGNEPDVPITQQGYRVHACPICGKRFPSKPKLEAHVRAHTGEKPFTCQVCGKSFTQKGNMQQHQAVHYKRATN